MFQNRSLREKQSVRQQIRMPTNAQNVGLDTAVKPLLSHSITGEIQFSGGKVASQGLNRQLSTRSLIFS
eukprot:6294582-Pyramimonas_sp.AAC.1